MASVVPMRREERTRESCIIMCYNMYSNEELGLRMRCKDGLDLLKLGPVPEQIELEEKALGRRIRSL